MIPTITAFEQSPDRGQGLARDMSVRWACEARPAFKRAFEAQLAVFTGKAADWQK